MPGEQVPKHARTRPATALGQPRRKISNGLVGRRSRRSDRKEQTEARSSMPDDAMLSRSSLRDVISGTQNVGHDELDSQGFGDAAYRLGNIDGGVKRLVKSSGTTTAPVCPASTS